MYIYSKSVPLFVMRLCTTRPSVLHVVQIGFCTSLAQRALCKCVARDIYECATATICCATCVSYHSSLFVLNANSIR